MSLSGTHALVGPSDNSCNEFRGAERPSIDLTEVLSKSILKDIEINDEVCRIRAYLKMGSRWLFPPLRIEINQEVSLMLNLF